MKEATKFILVSDIHGHHIPKNFCRNKANVEAIVHKNQEMWRCIEACRAGTDHPDYDESWDHILRHAELHTTEQGNKEIYVMHQDGDLWAVPHKDCIVWVPDEDLELDDDKLEDMHDSFLDEYYGKVKIGGTEYRPSLVVRKVNPTDYRCLFANWLDAATTDERIFEYNGKYYMKDVDEPDYAAYFDHEEGHNGKFYWREEKALSLVEGVRI